MRLSDDVSLALTSERDRIARDLNGRVIQQRFGVGLQLHAVAGVTDESVRPRLESSIATLDAVINQIRATIFELELGSADPFRG